MDTKIYIMLGKLSDNIVNKVISYAVNISITEWVYGFIFRNPKLPISLIM